MKGQEDRRVKLTKALLRDALVQLLKTVHISRISVTALCDAADVNRSTFYAHYQDQYDLLKQLQSEVLENIQKYIEAHEFDRASSVTEQKLVRILEYAKRNAELIAVLLSENCGSGFLQEIMEFVSRFTFPAAMESDERTREYISLFGVSGCVSLLYRWLEHGMEESVDQMAALIWRLTQRGNLGKPDAGE